MVLQKKDFQKKYLLEIRKKEMIWLAEKFLVIAVEVIQDKYSNEYFAEWDGRIIPQKCETFQEANDIKRELEDQELAAEHSQVLIVPFEDIKRVSK